MKITLGGKEYELLPLVIKQNRFVEPLATKHADYFSNISQTGGKVRLLDITEDQALDFTKIVFHTLQRVKPDLTWMQFDEMPITMTEIMVALPACLQQSGLFKPATEAPPPTGEEQPSIGTASPQN